MAVLADDLQLRELEARSRSVSVGGISVVDAVARRMYAPYLGDHVEIDLTLTPPPAGRDTWNVDTTMEIRRHVRRIAEDLGIPGRVVASVHSAPDDPGDAAADGGDQVWPVDPRTGW